MSESTRLILNRGDPRDDGGWTRRLRNDAAIARGNQTPELRRITDVVVKRAIACGARGVALTGSTARAKRTMISDLDYHVVGARPDVQDLPADVDIYVSPPEKMRAKLQQGDDFVQWTLRCGCILYYTGVSAKRHQPSCSRICGRTASQSSGGFPNCGAWRYV